MIIGMSENRTTLNEVELRAVEVLARSERPDNPAQATWRAQRVVDWLRNAGVRLVDASSRDAHDLATLQDRDRLRAGLARLSNAEVGVVLAQVLLRLDELNESSTSLSVLVRDLADRVETEVEGS
jgi:hypothetical protein